MSENTNNSLSDLNNEGHKFNRLLKDTDIQNNKTQSDNLSDLHNEKNSFVKKFQSTTNKKDKDNLQTNINKTQNKINTTNEKGFSDSQNIDFNGNPVSLFDRDAMIDYARYINSDGSVKTNWQEYKKDEKGNYLLNNDRAINQPVLFKDKSLFSANNSDFSNEGLSIPNLITWSEKYPALQLRYQDFVYCRKLGYYPNNRLVVLRRFKGGVPDNLFDYFEKNTKIQYTQPLSTMITWLSPDDDIIDMEFNEDWEIHSDGFLKTLKNIKEKIVSNDKKDSKTDKSNFFEDLITSLAMENFASDDYKKEDGVPYTRSDAGNPNLIKQSMKRKTGGDGLKSEIKFSIKFEYEMRHINNIDPSIAFLDLISNSMRMGTSESEFRNNIPYLKNNDTIKQLISGNIAKFTDTFSKDIKSLTKDISSFVSDFISKGVSSINNLSIQHVSPQKGITQALEYTISRYREDLKASISSDTGLPSGIWHVTIGNPKAPIISCGDLVINRSKLKLGKELGYNDFPNSFEITYELESARPRGRNELIRIFNSGRGRLYVYPQAKNNPDFDLY